MNEHDFEVETLDLRDYIAVIRRRIWLLIITVVAVVAAAMTFTYLQTPTYEATTALMVSQSGVASDDAVLREIVLGDRELQTQREVALSTPVAQRVIDRLELDMTPRQLLRDVRVSALRDTNVLEITASALVPEDAAAISEAFAESYIAYRRDRMTDRALAAASDLEARTASLRERLDEISRAREATDDADEIAALDQESQALLTQLGQIAAQHAAVRSAEWVGSGGGDIIRPADVPTVPASPRPLRNLALAIVLGGMLGVGVAFLRDFMDDAVRSDEDVVRSTARPVLGHIPRWVQSGQRDRAITLTEPASPATEAFRTLRTNLRYLAVDNPIRSVLVTSSQQGEGKSTTSANLAVAAARSGSRVLLIDADLRKPTIHKIFGMSRGVRGLADVLAQEVSFADAIRDIGVTNLRVVPAGDIPPNPTELLSSVRMQGLIAQAAEVADLVVYDGPPLLGLADALDLSPKMDATLLVVDLGRIGRSAVRAAAQRLEAVGASLAGAVVNRIEATDGYYGYYYAGYRYAGVDQTDDKKPKGTKKEARQPVR